MVKTGAAAEAAAPAAAAASVLISCFMFIFNFGFSFDLILIFAFFLQTPLVSLPSPKSKVPFAPLPDVEVSEGSLEEEPGKQDC